jgi:2-pyrone-4,6-dicarboxylate lactonase
VETDGMGTSHVPVLASPDLNPRPPRLKFPAGACDSHAHVFGPRNIFPCAPNPAYIPPDVLPHDHERMLQTIGCSRAVFVQPAYYGTDNSAMVAAMKSGKLQYRGVAVIDDKTSDADLTDLHLAGVRAVRVSVTKAGLTIEEISQKTTRIAARIKPFGWHLQFLVRIKDYLWIEQIITRSSLVCVVDHFGFLPAADGMQSPGFNALLRLARLEHVWFKLIGYRSSSLWPFYPDIAPMAQALIAAAPDRCLWGTDWPHTNITPMPNDGDLADALGEWLPDAEVRDRVLVDNPARLFGFDR